jgi:trehalose 6-phosphate synthase
MLAPQTIEPQKSPAAGPAPRFVLMSNRGPIEHFFEQNGELASRASDGGVATVLAAVARSVPTVWIAAPHSPADHLAAERGNAIRLASGSRLRLVGEKPESQRLHAEFCNSILWFLQHSMLDRFEGTNLEYRANVAWRDGYLPVNMAFGTALARFSGRVDAVMLNDFHLYAAPFYIRCQEPSLYLQHFIHIPWPEPAEWLKLPAKIADGICKGLLFNDSLVFQTKRDVENFLETCGAFVPEASVNPRLSAVRHHGRLTRVWANPVSVDVEDLRRSLRSPEAEEIAARLEDELGEKTIVRIDRLDPTKNVDGGFAAFTRLLEEHPELVGRVRFLAFLQPSRTDVEQYRAYGEEVLQKVEAINARFRRGAWTPIKVFYEHNRLQALVAMKLYDVLLVNSHADGLNLISKEGPSLNEREGVLVLSSRAGSYSELSGGALAIEPDDTEATAAALYKALTMSEDERSSRARRLRSAILSHQSDDWLARLEQDIGEGYSGAESVRFLAKSAIPEGV